MLVLCKGGIGSVAQICVVYGALRSFCRRTDWMVSFDTIHSASGGTIRDPVSVQIISHFSGSYFLVDCRLTSSARSSSGTGWLPVALIQLSLKTLRQSHWSSGNGFRKSLESSMKE